MHPLDRQSLTICLLLLLLLRILIVCLLLHYLLHLKQSSLISRSSLPTSLRIRTPLLRLLRPSRPNKSCTPTCSSSNSLPVSDLSLFAHELYRLTMSDVIAPFIADEMLAHSTYTSPAPMYSYQQATYQQVPMQQQSEYMVDPTLYYQQGKHSIALFKPVDSHLFLSSRPRTCPATPPHPFRRSGLQRPFGLASLGRCHQQQLAVAVRVTSVERHAHHAAAR
jgi:hypothetical protein